ncbi:tRNA (guanosine(46)-N7)-methyltransferase TrmB [Aphanothece hegewaldii CCALA 016]|uniref:tRNA (guanine-N(7)-)-methyltransferase n=1 Tax=Aphanothece hegewaldii CCALA 016 TaxID=2107694 RepID=A0A2T1LYJ3_9CHRO|nr:tRNA (guanosine(46)-N7)-methyltransferase TrmB [Aphanothece hegewaldii]PSF37468.1 tRNA (guanosine(46)-N7)-methyltransferase TrmB [Aphanothece hegewaldii CCALA 016]
MTRGRIRQHVNPLSDHYSNPVSPPDWSKVYSHTQPLHLDIGCARGKFLLKMAALYPEINFLGTEIREALVIDANHHRDNLGLTNLHFIFCNINHSIDPILQSLPQGVLKWVTIQFPDPWFKQRHSKRRVVQPELVNAISEYLSDDGLVFLQSDVEAIELEMIKHFCNHPAFTKQHLDNNPFPVLTEREIATYNKNQPVYRSLFKKNVS